MILKIPFIAALFLLVTSSVLYADYIQGHVVEIDREQGELIITLCDVCGGEESCTLEELETHPHVGEELTTVTVFAPWLPRCLAEGMMVYAQGSFSEDDPSTFEAVQVFPQKKKGGKDKTGVRSRFRHRRGQGHHQGYYGE